MKDEDWYWLSVICFYGSLPLAALSALAVWSAARMAGQADEHEVKPTEKDRRGGTDDSDREHQRGGRQ